MRHQGWPPGELAPLQIRSAEVIAPGVPISRVRVTPMSFGPRTGYSDAQGLGVIGQITVEP